MAKRPPDPQLAVILMKGLKSPNQKPGPGASSSATLSLSFLLHNSPGQWFPPGLHGADGLGLARDGLSPGPGPQSELSDGSLLGVAHPRLHPELPRAQLHSGHGRRRR